MLRDRVARKTSVRNPADSAPCGTQLIQLHVERRCGCSIMQSLSFTCNVVRLPKILQGSMEQRCTAISVPTILPLASLHPLHGLISEALSAKLSSMNWFPSISGSASRSIADRTRDGSCSSHGFQRRRNVLAKFACRLDSMGGKSALRHLHFGGPVCIQAHPF